MLAAQLRSGPAPATRTLGDILRETVDRYGVSPALDDGATVLTYTELWSAAEQLAARLRAHGLTKGDRVGVRVPSGSADLYVAILGTVLAGCAYVPVDADDPQERADTVFTEATAAALVGAGLSITPWTSKPRTRPPTPARRDRTTMRGSSSRPGRPGSPRASP